MQSQQNKIFVEPYVGERKIEASVVSGFARVKQKTNLVGLRVIADAFVCWGNSSQIIAKGSTVFFFESDLYTSDWAKQTYECDGIEGKFSIADYGSIVCIK